MSRRLLIVAIIVLVLVVGFAYHLANTFLIKRGGADMDPGIPIGSFVILNKNGDIKPGTIVYFRKPGNEKIFLIQRVAAIEGDTLEINDGIAIRNRYQIEDRGNLKLFYHVRKWAYSDMPEIKQFLEKWSRDTFVLSLTFQQQDTLNRHFRVRRYGLHDKRNMNPVVVPKDHIFVLGDNRDAAIDSRHFGFVPVKNVVAVGVR